MDYYSDDGYSFLRQKCFEARNIRNNNFNECSTSAYSAYYVQISGNKV